MRKKPTKPNWKEIDPLLGTMTDQQLGDCFGHAASVIFKRREKLGISKYLIKTQCSHPKWEYIQDQLIYRRLTILSFCKKHNLNHRTIYANFSGQNEPTMVIIRDLSLALEREFGKSKTFWSNLIIWGLL